MLASYDRAIDDKLNSTEPNYSDLRLYREDDIEDDDIELELTDINAAALVIDEIENYTQICLNHLLGEQLT